MSDSPILPIHEASNNIEVEDFICQIQTIPKTALPPGLSAKGAYLQGRLVRALKRRIRYIVNYSHELYARSHSSNSQVLPNIGEQLQPGDYVKVKSREEIQATLNRWNSLEGCGFMEEMWQYCGTEQQVLKRVRKFMDERDYHIKRTKNLVILKDVCCLGTIDFGPCDRSCFYFWREEWLQKIEKGDHP